MLNKREWKHLTKLIKYTPVWICWTDAVGGGQTWQSVDECDFKTAKVDSVGLLFNVEEELITIILSHNELEDVDLHMTIPRGMVNSVAVLEESLRFGQQSD